MLRTFQQSFSRGFVFFEGKGKWPPVCQGSEVILLWQIIAMVSPSVLSVFPLLFGFFPLLFWRQQKIKTLLKKKLDSYYFSHVTCNELGFCVCVCVCVSGTGVCAQCLHLEPLHHPPLFFNVMGFLAIGSHELFARAGCPANKLFWIKNFLQHSQNSLYIFLSCLRN
jgi:hypothetical protein